MHRSTYERLVAEGVLVPQPDIEPNKVRGPVLFLEIQYAVLQLAVEFSKRAHFKVALKMSVWLS